MPYEYENIRTDKVATNIDEYIIPECQEACKSFWSKNIMTFMCSNQNEPDDTKYILINFGLSPENQSILKQLLETNPEYIKFCEVTPTPKLSDFSNLSPNICLF